MMTPLVSPSQMKVADEFTIQSLGIPELILMEHAALAVSNRLRRRFGSSLSNRQGLILAGGGNNGGDALAVARILIQNRWGLPRVLFLGNREKLSQSAKTHWNTLQKLGVNICTEYENALIENVYWVVDGIFGTGLSREISGPIKSCIERLNARASKIWIVSIDIPSGLCGATGKVNGIAVAAKETVCLGHIKQGLVTGEAADYVGKLHLVPIQISREIPDVTFDKALYGERDARADLPKRWQSGHKGKYGHVFLWAGEPQKEGAAGLSCLGALGAGSGLCTLISDRNLGEFRQRLALDVMSEQVGPDFFASPTPGVVAMGPGMGAEQRQQQQEILDALLATQRPAVLDADALNGIAKSAKTKKLLQSRQGETVITPHPKEAARLLGIDVSAVQADRYAACERLHEALGIVVVLKGRGTLIRTLEGQTLVVNVGNSALSKGGSGDILTGIIASFLSQGVTPERAAALGVYFHGKAAELAAQAIGSERAVLASELAKFLPNAIKTCLLSGV